MSEEFCEPPEWVLAEIPPGCDHLVHNPDNGIWLAIWANEDVDADYRLIADIHAPWIISRQQTE